MPAIAATKDGVDKLTEVRALKENGFSIETIKEKLPSIVIYDVPHTADGDPREEILSQNQNIQDLDSKDDFLKLTKKISHWPGRRSEYERTGCWRSPRQSGRFWSTKERSTWAGPLAG